MGRLWSLPVVAYHQINKLRQGVSPRDFDAQMAYLADRGYQTVFLADWVNGRVKPNGRTVAITFDDGTVDHWVYAYPILRKYGHRATMFAITGKPQSDTPPRANAADVWEGRRAPSDLPPCSTLWQAHRESILLRGHERIT